jgi:hypothetical protein
MTATSEQKEQALLLHELPIDKNLTIEIRQRTTRKWLQKEVEKHRAQYNRTDTSTRQKETIIDDILTAIAKRNYTVVGWDKNKQVWERKKSRHIRQFLSSELRPRRAARPRPLTQNALRTQQQREDAQKFLVNYVIPMFGYAKTTGGLQKLPSAFQNVIIFFYILYVESKGFDYNRETRKLSRKAGTSEDTLVPASKHIFTIQFQEKVKFYSREEEEEADGGGGQPYFLIAHDAFDEWTAFAKKHNVCVRDLQEKTLEFMQIMQTGRPISSIHWTHSRAPKKSLC